MTQTSEQVTVCVFKPECDIVASSLDEFRRELQTRVDGGCRELVIDLEKVSIIDSRGLAVFILCQNSLKSRGGTLRVVTRNADLRHLFRVMRMDQHISVTDQL